MILQSFSLVLKVWKMAFEYVGRPGSKHMA